MKINRIFNKVALASMITSLVTPLAILVPRVSAAADTCTWTGAQASPVVDSVAKTITFDMGDGTNWSGCDNGGVPESGDALVFPANMAQVDPGSSLTEDFNWYYIVDNTLLADTSFASITFSGDTGTSCKYEDDNNDDTYHITGNAISLSGDVINTYTGSCSNELAYLFVDVTTATDMLFEANHNGEYLGSNYVGVGDIDYGSNQITFCNSGNTANATRSIRIDGLNGDGEVIFNCRSNTLGASGGYSTGRNVTVASGSLNLQQPPYASVNQFTIADESSVSMSIYSVDPYNEIEIGSSFIFEGTGEASVDSGPIDYGNYTYESKDVYATLPRMSLYYTHYDSDKQISIPHNLKFTGDITFTEDVGVSHQANVEFSGTINGNGKKLERRNGSFGTFKVTSTNNTSATSGEQKLSYSVYEIDGIYGSDADNLYQLIVSSGTNFVLKTADTIAGNTTVNPDSKLNGIGTVGALDVLEGGILAPGLSPGCIATTGDLTLSGTYEVEINGASPCTGYDQTDVTGAVDVTGGTLNVSMLDSFNPTLNQEFIIIDNDAADAVVGTFTGLAEGASIEINGVTLGISYVGGDGNDVVLSATAVPATETAPDTGIGSIISNPLISLLALSLTGATLVGLRKVNLNKK